MPLFYQQNINGETKLALWHIKETEDFFLQKVPLSSTITHWHKRLQHLAGRYLLQELFPDFPYHLIEIADTLKPFLPNEEYHFSISHSGDYAAVLVSKRSRAGIDIEIATHKTEKIKHKFLSTEELSDFSAPDNRSLTLLWCVKEAVFKWYGNGEVDFKKHINITKSEIASFGGILSCKFLKEEPVSLNINYTFFDEICLAWVL